MVTEVGRDLDALVAEAMGFTRWSLSKDDHRLYFLATEAQVRDRFTGRAWREGYIKPAPGDATPYVDGMRDVPAYSTDMRAAGTVCEQIARDVGNLTIGYSEILKGFRAVASVIGWLDGDLAQLARVEGDTIPEAVCRLLLAATPRSSEDLGR